MTGQKMRQESLLLSSNSDAFNIETPIVIRVWPKNNPLPLKKTRRTKATVVNIMTVQEGHEHIENKRKEASSYGISAQTFNLF
jgi:hypothetical protein